MRHTIANALYTLARATDAPAKNCGNKATFGEGRYAPNQSPVSWSMSVHLRDDTAIGGSYEGSPNYTYAALNVADATLFLTRLSTTRLIGVLRQIEESFAKYGEAPR